MTARPSRPTSLRRLSGRPEVSHGGGGREGPRWHKARLPARPIGCQPSPPRPRQPRLPVPRQQLHRPNRSGQLSGQRAVRGTGGGGGRKRHPACPPVSRVMPAPQPADDGLQQRSTGRNLGAEYRQHLCASRPCSVETAGLPPPQRTLPNSCRLRSCLPLLATRAPQLYG